MVKAVFALQKVEELTKELEKLAWARINYITRKKKSPRKNQCFQASSSYS